MIKGLSVDNARPLPAPTTAKKTEKADTNFANQLLGAKSERLESPDRNERKNSGRDKNREGSRSADRGKDSKSHSDLRASREETAKRADKRERDDRVERKSRRDASESSRSQIPSSQHIPLSRSPAASAEEPPIVIENPKNSDSPDKDNELKLPDFFSKNALDKASKGDKSSSVGGVSTEGMESADLVSSMQDDEVLSREEAMGQFVTKMQDEFGISPDKLMKAFAQLDDKAMQAAPEASMGQFVKALGLSSEQEGRATELYQDLLKTTGQSLMSEKLAGLDNGIAFDVMSPRDASLRKLESSLDDLNKSFFRKGGDASDSKKAQSAVDSMDVELARLMMASSQGDLSSDSPDDSASAQASGESSPIAGLMAAGSNPLSALMGGQGEGQSDLASNGQQSGQASTQSGSTTKSALESVFAKEMSKELKDEDKGLGGIDAQAAKSDVALNDSAALTSTVSSLPGAQAKTAVLNPAEMMMNRQATSAEEQDNVRELIKEAQIMVKRGGGEMKMEMKPEGMGQIQLRVNVENGNVSVQMLTESESAKHLLEKGLSELKTNLAAHDLKVQSLSVDVGNDVKSQMDQQGTQDQARQKAQQFASDFMGSFRDERQGFQQGMMENRGWRSYGRGQGREEISPEPVARASSKSKSDNSKRLNLVA